MTVHPLALRRGLARSRAFLAILVIGLTLAQPLAAHAATADDATWTVRTVSNGFGEDRTGYEYTIDPGGTVDDGLVIANHGVAPLDLAVYAADGFTTDAGQLDLLTGEQESVAIGTWTSVGSDRVTVGAGETVTVPFTLTIPENATPGDYAGGIVTSLTSADDQAGINVDRRLGIRIGVRVGGDIAPALAIEDVGVAWAGGWNPFSGADATLTYTLHNTGNAVLSADQAASVGGPFGWFSVDAAATEAPPQLLPGETWAQTVTVPGVGPLIWLTGTATVTPLVVDPSGSTSVLDPVVATGSGWAVPWTLVTVALVLVLLAVLVPRQLKRRRAREKARQDARVQEAVQRALDDAKVPANQGAA